MQASRLSNAWVPRIVSTSLVLLVVMPQAGCRVIRRFGDQNSSVAARRLSGQGFQAMHEGRHDEAESHFQSALEVCKTDDRAHWGMAETHWLRGQPDQAIDQMIQAVELSGENPAMLERLGQMHLTTEDFEQADRFSRAAVAADRHSAGAWQLRGDCFAAANRNPDALACYHRAVALAPDSVETHLAIARVYEIQGRHDRTNATLNRLRDQMGDDGVPATVDHLQGLAMKNLGQFDDARRRLTRATEKDPTNVETHLELAALSIQTGHMTLAKSSVQQALRINPSVADDPRIAKIAGETRFAATPQALGIGMPRSTMAIESPRSAWNGQPPSIRPDPSLMR